MNRTGYSAGSTPPPPTGIAATGAPENDMHARRKREYLDYLGGKSEEIKEQKESRAYYHGAQWTDAQVRAFNKRKQPVVTFNRTGRKINAIIGLLDRQKQDPRGFPRTPKHEQGAELATHCLRYVCDQQRWGEISPICGMRGAVDGIGGIEIAIEQGDRGDPEIGLEVVDAASFFYDPRSLKEDFSDARYMGVGKWLDVEAAIEMFPEHGEALRDSAQSGYDLTSDPASDNKWVSIDAGTKRLRLVDHWYMSRGQWRYCIYTGSVVLLEGDSYLVDEMGKTMCRYVMYSANVDQDGDRYGFVRNMRSAQDEINMRRSKGLHLLNSRRMIIEDGEGLDVEKTRTEAAKPDGVIVHPQGTKPPTFDDSSKSAELTGQVAFLQDAKDEIENYGFNPALIGTGVQQMSGRAMQFQQQAGIAELGPYLLSFKAWKLRVYRAIWNAVRKHWTAERWIRVTDDENVAQFVAINQPIADEFGPVVNQDGTPALQNAISELDVDIILDEGPDTVTMQQTNAELLMSLGDAPWEVKLELAPIDGSLKKKLQEKAEQSQQRQMQMQMPAMQLEMQGKDADNKLTQAQTMKTIAEARNVGAQEPPEDPRPKIMEQRIKLQSTVAKGQSDQRIAALKAEGQELTNAGKRIDLARAAAQPQQPPQAA
jgi:hypothetical protein